jgi:hypothetical protein
MEPGHVTAAGRRHFPDFARDRQFIQSIYVAAMRPDELFDLLVGRSGGEGLFDRALRVGDTFMLQ